MPRTVQSAELASNHDAERNVQPDGLGGFAEGVATIARGIVPAQPVTAVSVSARSPAFLSTGPQGHRARMRDRLLATGADALADYELLEMLLFLGFPRGDTKRVAKGLINRFGSLAETIAAPSRQLEEGCEESPLGLAAVGAIKLVEAAARRLAQAEEKARPVLGDWDRLRAYLDAAPWRIGVSETRLLFLDNRNRLIGDERSELDGAITQPRPIFARALALHATALLVVNWRPDGALMPGPATIAATRRLAEAGRVLSIVLHDHVVLDRKRLISLRQQGVFG